MASTEDPNLEDKASKDNDSQDEAEPDPCPKVKVMPTKPELKLKRSFDVAFLTGSLGEETSRPQLSIKSAFSRVVKANKDDTASLNNNR